MTTKRILITGAGSGLGRGLAGHLAASGHKLLLLDRDRDGLDGTIAAIADPSSCLAAEAVDVTSDTQVSAFVAKLRGGVDVLVNNAGLQHVAKVDEFPIERWDTLMDVMLRGPFLLTRALLPAMRANGYGRIINIGSIHALIASPYKSAYVAAKHGMIGFSKAVALETGDVDITINTICPAYIRTPLVDAQIEAQAVANGISTDEVIANIMLAPMPKGRFIGIDEIAGTVEFLMSDAAKNITAQAIALDGGWTAR
ncbi:MAG TPA: 3-hydroxybutyrate dehydrogenase [Capsulimonadaceae bacterium]|jgi:3-hydroxybutyrate dehydrogenase